MERFPQRGDFVLWDEEGHDPLVGIVTKVTKLKASTRFTVLAPAAGFVSEFETKKFATPEDVPSSLSIVPREEMLEGALRHKDNS